MWKRKNLSLILIICLLAVSCLLAGCQQKQTAPADKAPSGKTITVTDSIGRQVTVPAQVERIACLYAYTGHVVTMLGKGEQIVAVVEGLKRDVLLNEINPAIQQATVPVVSGTINFEELAKTKPDLVFVKAETAANAGQVEKLDKSGIPYLVIDFHDIKTQQESIDIIGKAIGAEAQAKAYNQYYDNCIQRVQQQIAKIPAAERVRVYHSVNEAVRTDAKGTLPADWTKVAGAINVSVEENLKFAEGKYFASLEQILLWDPEVILVNEPGVAEYMLTNPQWASLQAVKQHKVYQMPIGMSRWGHPGGMETPLAILWTAKTLYPERFADLDMVAETKQFYQQFFNYQMTDAMAKRVLKGEAMRVPKNNENNNS